MRTSRTALAAALLALVVLDDRVLIPSRGWSVPLLAPLDWTGHLATSAIVLLAVVPAAVGRRSRLALAALVASVAIDVDHVPLYLGWTDGVGGGRPATHSLLTPLVLAAAALALPRARPLLAALAGGVLLHFVRDVATGPGVPLLVPLSEENVLLPWSLYAAVLAALVALVGARDLRERRAARPARALRVREPV
ncbi:metal-dependent hydrolase [Motilibacter rhizosphaerae]|uniref:metal-dependent hydrolase n=1 Tax=Motilibacter rhizosphaerae TaxID=598652 RepID=UPI0013EED6B7|nr:metal-dependent hydrolase [Motilibacter rhizosphaerae]